MTARMRRGNANISRAIFGQCHVRETIMKRLAESNEDKGIKITVAVCAPRVIEVMGGGGGEGDGNRTLSKRPRFARGAIINLISFGERAGLIVRSDEIDVNARCSRDPKRRVFLL